MADTKQQTILVKKADGTKVRVSLDEFKRMRNEEKEKTNNNKQIPNNIQNTKLQNCLLYIVFYL